MGDNKIEARAVLRAIPIILYSVILIMNLLAKGFGIVFILLLVPLVAYIWWFRRLDKQRLARAASKFKQDIEESVKHITPSYDISHRRYGHLVLGDQTLSFVPQKVNEEPYFIFYRDIHNFGFGGENSGRYITTTQEFGNLEVSTTHAQKVRVFHIDYVYNDQEQVKKFFVKRAPKLFKVLQGVSRATHSMTEGQNPSI